MPRFPSTSLVARSTSLLGVCGLLAMLTIPTYAQETGRVGTLSDVSGPFLGNIQTDTPPLVPPTSVSVSVSSIDTLTRDLILTAQELNLGEVLKICVNLSTNVDKMSPFAGCSDVNWAAYNRAVRDAKQLNRELLRSVREQKTALTSNPSPTQRDTIARRLDLLEKTTTALEATTKTLVTFGEAMDKAR